MPNVKRDRIRPAATKDLVHCLKTGRTDDADVACTNSLTAASQVARFADLPGNTNKATYAAKRRSHRDEPEYYLELADGRDSDVVRLTIHILLPRGFVVIERCIIMAMFENG